MYEKYQEREARAVAERYLAQLEDALANLCCYRNHRDYVAKAAIQLITERSSHIPTYTPTRMTGRETKPLKKAWAEMTSAERNAAEAFDEALEEAARRDYGQATATAREFYVSLTQLLTQFTHDPVSLVGVGTWRILNSYHPNLRFRRDHVKRRR